MTAGAKPYTMKVVRTVFNGGHEETYGNATRLVPTQQGYCWRTPFKVLGVLFLGEVSPAFLPSKKACGTHDLRPWGVRQQYPKGFVHIYGGRKSLILSTFTVVFYS